MLRSSDESMRGRVMGVRMLAIWGLPLGLLTAGPMIAAVGYPDHLRLCRSGARGDAYHRLPMAPRALVALGGCKRCVRGS